MPPPQACWKLTHHQSQTSSVRQICKCLLSRPQGAVNFCVHAMHMRRARDAHATRTRRARDAHTTRRAARMRARGSRTHACVCVGVDPEPSARRQEAHELVGRARQAGARTCAHACARVPPPGPPSGPARARACVHARVRKRAHARMRACARARMRASSQQPTFFKQKPQPPAGFNKTDTQAKTQCRSRRGP